MYIYMILDLTTAHGARLAPSSWLLWLVWICISQDGGPGPPSADMLASRLDRRKYTYKHAHSIRLGTAQQTPKLSMKQIQASSNSAESSSPIGEWELVLINRQWRLGYLSSRADRRFQVHRPKLKLELRLGLQLKSKTEVDLALGLQVEWLPWV